MRRSQAKAEAVSHEYAVPVAVDLFDLNPGDLVVDDKLFRHEHRKPFSVIRVSTDGVFAAELARTDFAV